MTLRNFRAFFPTLKELESDLSDAKKNQNEAIVAKDFALAQKLNALVEKLEEKVKIEIERSSEKEVMEPSSSNKEPESNRLKERR
jgi:hypothetical protein